MAEPLWLFSSKKVPALIGILGYSYCVYYTVTRHIASFVVLFGDSMQPTFNKDPGSREVVLVKNCIKRWNSLKHNDIVVAAQPDKPNTLICKRIIAMEGERVPSKVKDFSLPHKYYKTVPKGHVWLEGDNKRSSYDSRDFGPLPLALVQSRVIYRLWPLSKIGTIKS